MTEPRANPLVGAEAAEELAAQEVGSTAPAPIAEAPETPIERRSRRSGKPASDAGGAAEQPKQPVDLTQFEEFRKVQAEYDRRIETERKRAADLQRQMEERQQKEAFDRLAYLEQLMDDDTQETEQRRAARQEYQFLSAQTLAQQWQRWDSYKRQAISEAGLDISDPRFQRQYSPGQAGLAEFQADLAAAENARLKQELTQAKKQAVTPETLAELVRQEVAKLTKAQGIDRVDLAEPGEPGQDAGDAFDRDWAAFNNGRMSAAEFNRRHGGGWR